MPENNDLLSYSSEEIEQLLNLSEELQTENEQYRAENKNLQSLMNAQQVQIQTFLSDNQNLNVENSELKMKLYQAEQMRLEKVQKMLSERQELFLIIQELEQRVQQLTEQNEMLNESDLELKKAEDLQNRLREKEKHWQNEIKRSQEEVLNAEKRANKIILQANSEKEKAVKKKSEYDNLIISQKKLTEERAKQLNEKYRNKYQLIWLIILAYSVLATLLTGYQSERVVNDCIGAITAVKDFCISGFMNITAFVEKIGSVGEKIEQPIVSQIVSVLIGSIAFVAVLGAILVLLYLIGKFIVNVYKENCLDEISLFVVMMTVVVLVWFAALMPINIVLILLLSHIGYIGVRWYIKGYKENH